MGWIPIGPLIMSWEAVGPRGTRSGCPVMSKKERRAETQPLNVIQPGKVAGRWTVEEPDLELYRIALDGLQPL